MADLHIELRMCGKLFHKEVDKMVKVAILTASDRSFSGEREDKSGPLLEKLVASIGGKVLKKKILPDEKNILESELSKLADEEEFDLICTTGGTGLSPRDHTPDATLAILDKEIPGMSEAMRYKSFSKTPHALLSRAVCGIRGKTLIINLPGSPKAIEENFDVIAPALPHAIELIQGNVNDCNEENE